MKSTDYIKFVVSKVEDEFLVYSNGLEYVKVMTVLQSIKASDDILRDVFILTGTKKLRMLSHYLLFILKKYESGRITLDNFLENLNTDRNFIINYLHTYYHLEPVETPAGIEEPETIDKFIFDTKQEEEETHYSLIENVFHVTEIDNELITEEFSESDITEDTHLENKMELVEAVITPASDNQEIQDDVFSLPDDNKTGKIQPGKKDRKINTNERSTLDSELSESEKPNEVNINETGNNADAGINNEEIITVTETGDRNIIINNSAANNENFIDDDEKDINKKLEEIEASTSTEIINSRFQDYQKEVFEKNESLRGFLNDLDLIFDHQLNTEILKPDIHHEINSVAQMLRDLSLKMSFEIITKIYSIISVIFEDKFEKLINSSEYTSLVKEGLDGVERLIKGEELSGFEEVIKKLEDAEKDFNQLLKSREEYEKKKTSVQEDELKIIDEFKDTSERTAYLALREKILALEYALNKIYQPQNQSMPFEFLRKLSVTFTYFREIVNISRILEINKVAQLAEAGYCFVKFIQNYRIDPYQKEVSEVFRYLVYCLKLIYLDKPVGDIDVFISYLNDPVKIFHNKNKK